MERTSRREILKSYCEQHILPELTPLEEMRKAALKKIVLFTTMTAVVMIATLAILGQRQAPGHVVFGVFVVCVAVIVAGIRMLRFDVSGEFRRIAVAKLVSFVDNGLSYDPKGRIERETFAASGIFPGRFGFYKGSDLVSGNAGGTAYSFSYLLVSRTRSDTRRRRSAPVFQGLFFAIDGKRAVRGITAVRPNRTDLNAASFLEKKLRSLFGSGGEEVRFDDPGFAGRFTVHSTEPGEARTILTPDMRRRIMDLGQRSDKGLSLSFVGQKVYAALSFDAELFGAHLTRTVIDPDSMEANFTALQLAKGIAEDLGLN